MASVIVDECPGGQEDDGNGSRRDPYRAMLPEFTTHECELVTDHAALPLTLATNRSATDGV